MLVAEKFGEKHAHLLFTIVALFQSHLMCFSIPDLAFGIVIALCRDFASTVSQLSLLALSDLLL